MSETPASTPAVVVIEKNADAIIARVHVKMLDDKELKLLGQQIDQAAGAAGVAVVVIDLSHVQILPSLGLGALVQISNKCKARNQSLKLAGAQAGIRKVFAITRLDRVLDLVDSVDAALR
jgi:anti-anti-sigma factor